MEGFFFSAPNAYEVILHSTKAGGTAFFLQSYLSWVLQHKGYHFPARKNSFQRMSKQESDLKLNFLYTGQD